MSNKYNTTVKERDTYSFALSNITERELNDFLKAKVKDTTISSYIKTLIIKDMNSANEIRNHESMECLIQECKNIISKITDLEGFIKYGANNKDNTALIIEKLGVLEYIIKNQADTRYTTNSSCSNNDISSILDMIKDVERNIISNNITNTRDFASKIDSLEKALGNEYATDNSLDYLKKIENLLGEHIDYIDDLDLNNYKSLISKLNEKVSNQESLIVNLTNTINAQTQVIQNMQFMLANPMRLNMQAQIPSTEDTDTIDSDTSLLLKQQKQKELAAKKTTSLRGLRG